MIPQYNPKDNKKFDPALHKKHDAYGKAIAKWYWEFFGYTVIPNDTVDPYEIDFLVKKQGEEDFYVEVEHTARWNDPKGKKGYTGAKFPYGTAHVPKRKKRYYEKYNKACFLGVDFLGHYLFITWGPDILASKIVPEYVNGELEMFFDVPMYKIKIWDTKREFQPVLVGDVIKSIKMIMR